MFRYRPPVRLFAAALSALAGFVDAVGFIKLGGFFVSFMSGNSTRLAVDLAQGRLPLAAGLILAFILGVTLSALLAGVTPLHRRPAGALGLVTGLLVLAAVLAQAGVGPAAAAAMAMAMGAENGVFAGDGEAPFGLTYMTGALVKLGQRLAAALRGGDPFGWAPYLLLWLGLVAGAVVGAAAYQGLGDRCLWIAVGAAAIMTLAAVRFGALEDHLVTLSVDP